MPITMTDQYSIRAEAIERYLVSIREFVAYVHFTTYELVAAN